MTTGPARCRLDLLLVERGLAGSRDRAQRLILAGEVWSDGQRLDKPGHLVATDLPLEVRGEDIPYVSRGGLKLEGALEAFGLEVTGRRAADIGASTGGFTDCLLQRGVRHVTAIDVGYGQFAWKLRQDPRVTLFERRNIREFRPEEISQPVDLAVIDVSFISLRLVLPAVVPLLESGAVVLPLVKPQFEVGKGQVGSGGVVRDPAKRQEAVDTVRAAAIAMGFDVLGETTSPILGPKGNVEFFLWLRLVSAGSRTTAGDDHSPPAATPSRRRETAERGRRRPGSAGSPRGANGRGD